MLLHIECHQFFDRPDRVERVKVEPLMFKHTQPGFDQRIGERDLGLSQDLLEQTRVDPFVDGANDVLNTGVGQEHGFLIDHSLRCGE